jgi:broad specificity phosphatase PhoE
MALVIKLIRHGQSEANTAQVSPLEVGDHAVALSAHGREQVHAAGQTLGAAYLRDALVYLSPYRRARETWQGILAGSGLDPAEVPLLFEDPRLREVDHGYDAVSAQMELRRRHGWFYYRFRGGESPADCFDRTSSFLESMMREVQRKSVERVLIVTHGLTIRCFVMRFLHLTVEQFDTLAGPDNCEIVTLGPRDQLEGCLFTSGRWGVTGLRIREDD